MRADFGLIQGRNNPGKLSKTATDILRVLVNPCLAAPRSRIPMKTLSLLCLSFLSIHSEPIWIHPNVQAALPAVPVAPGELQLDSGSIEREFPQSSIWYSGDWVGYFVNEWRAPIWTTPAVGPAEFADDGPTFQRILFPPPTLPSPFEPPGNISNPIMPPVVPPGSFFHPLSPPTDSTPPVVPGDTLHSFVPPIIIVHPLEPPSPPSVDPIHIPEAPVSSDVPEPAFLSLWPLWILYGVFMAIRK